MLEKQYIYPAFLILFISILSIRPISSKNFKGTSLPSKKLSECEACRIFVKSFENGVENTKKGKYEGGDAAWEEEKLGSYSSSELRLVEIQERICSDVIEGKEQCYRIHEEFAEVIEEWWFDHRRTRPNLHEYLCIDKLKRCCPDFHYGKDCSPCPGFPGRICSSNGICIGNGTRAGTGNCKCNKGYLGKICDKCAKMHYETRKDDRIVCSPCPPSCRDSCKENSCENCAEGWVRKDDGRCVDIDECSENVCGAGKYCVNTEGGYKCPACHIGCEECTGKDKCLSCTEGYSLILNRCIETIRIKEREFVYIMKILLLLGFCTAYIVVQEKSRGYIAAITAFVFYSIFTATEYVLVTMTYL